MKNLIKSHALKLTHLIRKPPIATLLALASAAVAIFSGGPMLFDPAAYLADANYDLVTAWVSPYFWGLVFLGIGIWLLIEIFRRRQDQGAAHVAVVLICVLHCIVALLLGITELLGGTGTSPVWHHIGLAAYAAITQYSLREGDAHAVEEALTDHQ